MPDGANDQTQFTPPPAPGITPGHAGRTNGASVPWRPPEPLELQAQLPQYKVLDLIGHGGMGAVYKGWQVSLERYVAIKILPPDLDDEDVQFAARFKQEAKTMAKFQHPGIISVYDAGETASGLLYIVMEFVEGTDVSQMVRTQGRLPPEHALAIVAHVCDALQYAHSHGVMHRDIKPANVMLNSEGQVKVADFGLAKATGSAQMGLTRTDMSMGTPDYIAPESLVLGVTPDHRADLYAVGVMLYNMLTGEIPRGKFKMPSQKAGTDPRFDAIIDRAMEQEREHRYQSAHEIRRDLDVILSTPMERVQPGSEDTLVRHQRIGGEAAQVDEADRSVRAPSRAPVKKSGAGMLIAGLGAAAVIGIGAFVTLKKPATAPSGAGSESAEAKAASVPAPKVWVDLMPLLRKDVGLRNAVEEDHGIRITAPVLASKLAGIKARNVVARVVMATKGRAVNMSLRMGPQHECYRVLIEPSRVSFEMVDVPGGRPWFGLGEMKKLPAGFDPKQENEYVFAAIGNKLRVWINHKFIGEAEDDRQRQGDLSQSFALDDRIQKWEYGILPDDEAVAVSPSPAPQVPPVSASTEKWEDALLPSVKLNLTGPVTRTSAGLRFTGNASVWHDRVSRDSAARIHATFDNLSPQVRVRNGEDGLYGCNLRDSKTVIVQRWDVVAKKATILGEFPLPKALDVGQDYELELRAIGQTLTVRLNGSVLGSIPDASLPSGNAGVGFTDYKGTATVVKSLEVLDLDAPGKVSQSSATPGTATKDAPYVNSLGMKFVPVPGTKVLFSVWDTRLQDYADYAAANPKVDGAWKTQAKDGVPVGREPNHPVVGVSWEDAQAFCQWLTAKETAGGKLPQDMKYRLPSDEEWSWAVGLPPETGATPLEKGGKNGVDFPWGRDWPPTKKAGNYADESFHGKFPKPDAKDPVKITNAWMEGYDDGYATTSPVGSFPANVHGLYDMGGNVWQWCEDWYDASHKDRLLRGASWANDDRRSLLSSNRYRYVPTSRYNYYGFRCVLAETSPAASAVSESSAPKVSQSTEKFPPVQWVKVDWANQPVFSGKKLIEAGRLHLAQFSGWYSSAVPGFKKTLNGAIRFRWQRTVAEPSLHVLLRQDTAPIRRFEISGGNGDFVVTQFAGVTTTPLGKIPCGKYPPLGEESAIQVAAVGTRLFLSRDGTTLGSLELPGPALSGAFGLQAGDALIGETELLNLDGLPEPEALRILGVDEKGNDVRGK